MFQNCVSLFVNANVYVTIWNKQSNNVAYFALYNNNLKMFQHLKYEFSSKNFVANKWKQNIVRQYFDKPTFCILTIWFLLLKLVVAIMKWDTRLVWNFHHIMFSYNSIRLVPKWRSKFKNMLKSQPTSKVWCFHSTVPGKQ